MKKLAVGVLVISSLLPVGSAYADHYRGDRDDCNREGNCNDQRRCSGDNCRGSFSPGPFDRSPVDIHDNNVCISPDCSSHRDGDDKGKKSPGQEPTGIACLVPFPYHCDPKPE